MPDTLEQPPIDQSVVPPQAPQAPQQPQGPPEDPQVTTWKTQAANAIKKWPDRADAINKDLQGRIAGMQPSVEPNTLTKALASFANYTGSMAEQGVHGTTKFVTGLPKAVGELPE